MPISSISHMDVGHFGSHNGTQKRFKIEQKHFITHRSSCVTLQTKCLTLVLKTEKVKDLFLPHPYTKACFLLPDRTIKVDD